MSTLLNRARFLHGTATVAGLAATVKTGVDEVLAFFGQLAKAGFRAEPLFLAALPHRLAPG